MTKTHLYLMKSTTWPFI